MVTFLSRLLLPSVMLLVPYATPHSSLGETVFIDFETAWIPNEHGGYLGGFSSDSTIGWSFTPLHDIWVTDLGFIDWGIGLSMRHAVGIWDAEDQLLTSYSVLTTIR